MRSKQVDYIYILIVLLVMKAHAVIQADFIIDTDYHVFTDSNTTLGKGNDFDNISNPTISSFGDWRTDVHESNFSYEPCGDFGNVCANGSSSHTRFDGLNCEDVVYSFHIEQENFIRISLANSFPGHSVVILDSNEVVLSRSNLDFLYCSLNPGTYFIAIDARSFSGSTSYISEWCHMGLYCEHDGPNVDWFSLSPCGHYFLTIEKTAVIVSEDFNSEILPLNWEIERKTADLTLSWHLVPEIPTGYAMESSHETYSLPYDEWLISPIYDFSNFENLRLFFKSNYIHGNGIARVMISSNAGISWSSVNQFNATHDEMQLIDISAYADHGSNVRIAFSFSSDFQDPPSAWRVDDFQVVGVPIPPVALSPIPTQPAAPWSALTGQVGCTWTHPIGIDGSAIELRIDANGDGDYLDGGDEDWLTLPDLDDGSSLSVEATRTWDVSDVHLCFEFRARNPDGSWGFSGARGEEGIQDDWFVNIAADPPVADTPIPQQPPQPWNSTSGAIGCVWHHPTGIDGTQLQVRWDVNGDGDVEDGGSENWQSLPVQENATVLTVITTAVFASEGDSLVYEFGARALNGVWGYSGFDALEGPIDDWMVSVITDLQPPQFTDYLPLGQPNPAWEASRISQVGLKIGDIESGVDASSIEWRVDWNHDETFDGPDENWATLSGYSNGPEVLISQIFTLPEDGEYRVEIRASDLLGNGPVSSGPILVRVDATPPTPSNLFSAGANNSAVELIFSPTIDLTFLRYEIHVSTDPEVSLSDPVWGPQQDPDLAIRTTSQTTVAGLQPGTGYWFKIWAVDQAGGISDGSNTAYKVTGVTPIAAIQDLLITSIPEGLLLTWTAPVLDVNGDSPVAIERYDIHASTEPWFTPSQNTRIATTQVPLYLINLPRTQSLAANCRVITIGSGVGAPLTGMVQVPPGNFIMGPDALGFGSAHSVTLTHPFWMDRVEVTNQDYLEAVQWALGQGLVTATAATVMAHGQELLDLDDIDCEIAFDPATQQFSLVARSHSTEYGGPGPAYPNGYNPARHPVKELTWYGAACYCDWRSLQENLTPFYNGNWTMDASHNPYDAEGYRLPTEAEWEYTARYDDGRLYPWGNTEPVGCEIANLNCVGWTKSVGLYPQGDNMLGIKDLTGNMLEFTNDWYAPEYSNESIDPIGPSSGTSRVRRGGGFGDAPLINAQATARLAARPVLSEAWMGFRTLRSE
jgi:formylglycine-generating enzyme required for sulfatase activity